MWADVLPVRPNRCKNMRNIFFLLIICLIIGLSGPARADDCKELVLTPKGPAYHIYPDYYAVCPGDGTRIRCYHYHWDWVCEKGDTLYWDRRLEAAAHAACGCPMPKGVAPASPFVSKKTRPDIFSPGE